MVCEARGAENPISVHLAPGPSVLLGEVEMKYVVGNFFRFYESLETLPRETHGTYPLPQNKSRFVKRVGVAAVPMNCYASIVSSHGAVIRIASDLDVHFGRVLGNLADNPLDFTVDRRYF